jgi:polyhydroxyalkanoate synthase
MSAAIDLLAAAEAELARGFDAHMHDEATLRAYGQLWRIGLASLAAVPAPWRGVALAAPRRGPDPSGAAGGLGSEYPVELAQLVRWSWSAAAWASGWQNKRLLDLAVRLSGMSGPAFAPTPSRTVYATGDLRLRAIAPDGAASGEPILIVSSLINRWYILDLQPGQSFVAMLRELGRPVYLLEWLAARPGDNRTFGDLVAGPIRAAVDWIRAAHDGRAVSLVGYSMGGTLATCLAARYPERVARLATVCAPIRFAHAGSFARWLAPDLVDVDLVAAAWDRIPAPLVHLPFWWLRPTTKLQKLVQLARGFERPGFLETFLATEIWNHDNVDLPRGAFRSWIGELYQRDALVQGQLVVDGLAIDPRTIACPVLAISAASDAIAPPEAAEALGELCSATTLRLDTGHVGVMTSRRALAAQRTALATWLEQP